MFSALRIGLAFATSALICFSHGVSAAEYQSVGAEPIILYDAPTLRGKKIFVAPPGMPVEVIVPQGDWLRVRDAEGGLAWVEKKGLSTKRMLIVSSALATVYRAADSASSALFQAPKGVLLEPLERANAGWVHVKHQDGATGYISSSDVWGE